MKKIILAISFVLLLVIALFASKKVLALEKFFKFGPRNDFWNRNIFNPDNELSKAKCNAKGDPMVDVTMKVLNDVDSGLGDNAYFPGNGNFWNVESFTKRVRFWQTGENTYCAVVTFYNGRFNAFYKQTGPGGTGLIGSGVEGEMSGGYRTTFTGTLLSTPLWATNGNVGTFDYNCDLLQNCSGSVDWTTKYFSTTTGFENYSWWGWQYKAGSHGTWINSSDANTGNIL